jgi:hypothetical protein
MRKIDDQARITECAKKAVEAPNEDARRIWKQMEEFWRQKASRPELKLRSFAELRRIGSPPMSPN